jgi:hypothetical protein
MCWPLPSLEGFGHAIIISPTPVKHTMQFAFIHENDKCTNMIIYGFENWFVC